MRSARSPKGKVAIVTGAGAMPGGIGNGQAAAVPLEEDECSVVYVDLKEGLSQYTVG
jgi:NAD(P)-dependent dehydrogenase (short-subunit alcohol dehydrogenase family)